MDKFTVEELLRWAPDDDEALKELGRRYLNDEKKDYITAAYDTGYQDAKEELGSKEEGYKEGYEDARAEFFKSPNPTV